MTEIIKNSNESNIKLKKTMRLIKEIIVLAFSRSLNCCEKTVFLFLKITYSYLESAFSTIIPSTPQESISPIPTVSIINGIGSGTPYPYAKTNGTTIVLAMIGGSGARKELFLRRVYVKQAAIRVAKPPNIFPIRQPINNPGIAAGVKNGRMVRDSATLT